MLYHEVKLYLYLHQYYLSNPAYQFYLLIVRIQINFKVSRPLLSVDLRYS